MSIGKEKNRNFPKPDSADGCGGFRVWLNKPDMAGGGGAHKATGEAVTITGDKRPPPERVEKVRAEAFESH